MRSILTTTITAALAFTVFTADAASDRTTRGGGVFRLADSAQIDSGALLGGTALVASGRSLVRRSEALDVGPVTLRSKGTALVSTSRGNAKITCLEGRIDVRLAQNSRQFIELQAGQLILVEEGARNLPAAIEIDLGTIHSTARLLSKTNPELPTARSMERALRKQQREIEKGLLIKSNVSLNGDGDSAEIGGSTSSSSNQNSSGSSSGGGSGGSGSGGSAAAAGSGAAGGSHGGAC